MTRPILLLARLNEADLALDATKARLAEIAEALREPPTLVAARATLATAQQEVDRLRAEQAEVEGEEAKVEQEMRVIEQKLYNGKVSSPCELENGEKDLAQHQHQKARIDDHLLEIMVALEGATAVSEKAEAEVKRLAGEWETRQGILRGEQAKLKARLPGEQARQATARAVHPRSVPARLRSPASPPRGPCGGCA